MTLCEEPSHYLEARDTAGSMPSEPYMVCVWYNILFSGYSSNIDHVIFLTDETRKDINS